MDALYNRMAANWKPLGIYLHIPMATLNAIAKEQSGDPHECLLRMLEAARSRVEHPLSWTAVAQAVEFLGEEQLGRELRDKYCH